MEERKLNVSFGKGGSGSFSPRIAVPITWLRDLGIDEENKEVTLIKEDGKIILKRRFNMIKFMDKKEAEEMKAKVTEEFKRLREDETLKEKHITALREMAMKKFNLEYRVPHNHDTKDGQFLFGSLAGYDKIYKVVGIKE